MKNIVVLSTSYYPEMSASSAVFDKYLQQMKEKYVFHVVTATWYDDFEPLNDPTVKIYYISCFWHRLRVKAESRFRKNPSFFNRLVISLFRVRTFILWHLLYPLPTKWEINQYYKKLEELSNQINIGAIITVSGMINVQFSAKKFKEIHPDIKWVTFFTDPFTNLFVYYPPLKIKKQRMEKNRQNEISIYNTADYNYILEDHYEKVITEFKQPVEKTFRMRFSLENIRKRCTGNNIKPSKDIKLIYAGRLYRKIRNPEFMLSVISKVNQINLDLYIMEHECDDIIIKYTSDRIKMKGAANRETYENMICNEYDILVNIGNNCDNLSPSKMFELLSSGRPIVNFYYRKDSQYVLIERYPLGLNIGRDDKDASIKLEKFCKDMKGKQLEFSEVEKLYPENSLRDQVVLFEKLING